MHPPKHTRRAARGTTDDVLVRAWLSTHRETAELHARLQYLMLILRLGVRGF